MTDWIFHEFSLRSNVWYTSDGRGISRWYRRWEVEYQNITEGEHTSWGHVPVYQQQPQTEVWTGRIFTQSHRTDTDTICVALRDAVREHWIIHARRRRRFHARADSTTPAGAWCCHSQSRPTDAHTHSLILLLPPHSSGRYQHEPICVHKWMKVHWF